MKRMTIPVNKNNDLKFRDGLEPQDSYKEFTDDNDDDIIFEQKEKDKTKLEYFTE